MKLTFEELKKLIIGYIDAEEKPDGMYFYKCTPRQREAWTALSDVLGYRASNSTGIRLDFITNSTDVEIGVFSGKKYDIYVDDELLAYYEFRDPKIGGIIKLALDGAEHRVTLWMPSHDDIGAFKYVRIDCGSDARPLEYDKKILFIGDSITQGWDSKHDSRAFAPLISREFNAESVIQGTGGGYFHENTFDHIDFDPDLVFVAYGTNDWGHYKTLAELSEHAEKFLSLIAEEYKDKKLFYISPIWRADGDKPKAMGSFEDCRNVLISIAERLGFIHVNGADLVPHETKYYADGYLHPNEAGFKFYADNLTSQLKKYL